MKLASYSLLILFSSAVLASAQGDSVAQGSGPIYITHVTVIDTETGRELRDQTVVISGDRISGVKSSQKVKPLAGSKVVDASGKFLIPGLWDMHVHRAEYESTYAMYLVNGVTGIRDMAGPPDANKFRTELAAKTIDAPHTYLASPIIDGYPPRWPGQIAVRNAEEARRVVDSQKHNGADFIKVYDRLSRESYFAIIDEARRQHIPVVGHVPFAISAWEASASGQISIEHLHAVPVACSSREAEIRAELVASPNNWKVWNRLYLEAYESYTDAKCQRLFEEFRRNGTWSVPTLVVFRSAALSHDPQFRNDDRLRYFGGQMRTWLARVSVAERTNFDDSDFALERELFTRRKALVGKLFRGGVPLLAGTDTPNPWVFPGFGLHDELALLAESGVSPLGALQAATRNPALFLGATDKCGTVAPGKIADLVLLDADPLADIHNTTKIREVFLGGKEFDRSALDEILKKAETAATVSDHPQAGVTDSAAARQPIDSAFYGFWTLNVEKSDFAGRVKPKTGFVNWGEHGWTLAIVQADDRVYADAVETTHGCTFIGTAPNDLSCTVEVVTPRHIRLIMKQGTTVLRIGDIELLADGTTQTTHHVTPPQGAPYVEKTIWEKQARK